uniref:PDZ domain-containing protein n=1 Tax=Cyprinus carpio TaxID=7962 RepID=A0A8C1QZK7_CYPCA
IILFSFATIIGNNGNYRKKHLNALPYVFPNLEGYEIHEVALKKKEGQSLGVTIIGHNALTTKDAVGIFVKSVVPGSAAEQSGKILVHDRIIALDGVNLQGFTNQEVLEVMKRTGDIVHLTLIRKINSPKRTAVEKSLDKDVKMYFKLSHSFPFLS